ncbi:MAG: putative metal-binding motif-containing protein [Nanoarchaeota archaeon]|nr:putative metal-binding motif-containing protein [Nanoarchaeota archaeon]
MSYPFQEHFFESTDSRTAEAIASSLLGSPHRFCDPIEDFLASGNYLFYTTPEGSSYYLCPGEAYVMPVCTDNDWDGYGVGADTSTCSFQFSVDCNDNNMYVNPGAIEDCLDSIDNNCDGLVNEYCCTDNDWDGYGVGADTSNCRSPFLVDCNDNDATIYPHGADFCGDQIDNDCTGAADEGCIVCTDSDGDGFSLEPGCSISQDCDDGNAAVYPGLAEICSDGKDNNCASGIDENCPPPCSDVDEDGYSTNCGVQLDCDDGNAEINPGATDIAGDGIDQDCSGSDTFESVLDEGPTIGGAASEPSPDSTFVETCTADQSFSSLPDLTEFSRDATYGSFSVTSSKAVLSASGLIGWTGPFMERTFSYGLPDFSVSSSITLDAPSLGANKRGVIFLIDSQEKSLRIQIGEDGTSRWEYQFCGNSPSCYSAGGSRQNGDKINFNLIKVGSNLVVSSNGKTIWNQASPIGDLKKIRLSQFGANNPPYFSVTFEDLEITSVCAQDSDEDGIPDTWDNCPLEYNLDQVDANLNGVGDVCDPACSDVDEDGYSTNCGVQLDCDDGNAEINPGATDIAGDGIDQDCDGVDDSCIEPSDCAYLNMQCSASIASFVEGVCTNTVCSPGECASVSDMDGDGIVDSEDEDIDGDDVVNEDDEDIDGDDVVNEDDEDVDGDGINNDLDPDDDGDGIVDGEDASPIGVIGGGAGSGSEDDTSTTPPITQQSGNLIVQVNPKPVAVNENEQFATLVTLPKDISSGIHLCQIEMYYDGKASGMFQDFSIHVR